MSAQLITAVAVPVLIVVTGGLMVRAMTVEATVPGTAKTSPKRTDQKPASTGKEKPRTVIASAKAGTGNAWSGPLPPISLPPSAPVQTDHPPSVPSQSQPVATGKTQDGQALVAAEKEAANEPGPAQLPSTPLNSPAAPPNAPNKPVDALPEPGPGPSPAAPPIVPAADRNGDSAPVEWLGGASWAAWSRFSGNWAGVRDVLAERGLTIEPTVIWEVGSVASGGIADERRSGQRCLVDVAGTAELDPILGWTGASVVTHVQFTGGNQAGRPVGDAQGWSNIASITDLHQISEWWFQQALLPGADPDSAPGLRFKVGKIDSNADFAVVDSAGQFIHSSAGHSPTIMGMPAFPDPACGIEILAEPAQWLSLGFGCFDGSAQRGVTTGNHGIQPFFDQRLDRDKFWIAQASLHWNLGDSAGSASIGGWRHSGWFEYLDGRDDDGDGAVDLHHGTSGFYLTAEQDVWHDDSRRLSVFAQFGWADRQFSEISRHLAGGVYLSGIIDDRPDDGIGLYVSQVRFSTADPTAFETFRETAIELVGVIQAAGWWQLKMDGQYLLSPGGATSDHTMVLSARSIVTF
ncbi:hypothetical protein LBMAG53_08820 [Planctomycetota bacterium]|nr:hypothetical protein LBMAG53_08820 [Planctomycetota bacterium]